MGGQSFRALIPKASFTIAELNGAVMGLKLTNCENCGISRTTQIIWGLLLKWMRT